MSVHIHGTRAAHALMLLNALQAPSGSARPTVSKPPSAWQVSQSDGLLYIWSLDAWIQEEWGGDTDTPDFDDWLLPLSTNDQPLDQRFLSCAVDSALCQVALSSDSFCCILVFDIPDQATQLDDSLSAMSYSPSRTVYLSEISPSQLVGVGLVPLCTPHKILAYSTLQQNDLFSDPPHSKNSSLAREWHPLLKLFLKAELVEDTFDARRSYDLNALKSTVWLSPLQAFQWASSGAVVAPEAARRNLRKPGHCSSGAPPRHSVLEARPLRIASAAGP